MMNGSCCAEKGSCGCGPSAGRDGQLQMAGRWLFATPLFIFGIFHFINGQMMTGMLAGWPAPLFFVYLSGAGLILSAIAIVINRYAKLAATLLAVELGLFVLIIHLPGLLAGGGQMSLMGLLKDAALAGSALFMASGCVNRGFSVATTEEKK